MFFKTDEHKDYFIPRITIDGAALFAFSGKGSFKYLPARLMNLEYHEFLRYVRDNYNGMIVKIAGELHIAFKAQKDCTEFVRYLNQLVPSVIKHFDEVYEQRATLRKEN